MKDALYQLTMSKSKQNELMAEMQSNDLDQTFIGPR
jgi:hypothetical protein